MPGVPAGGGMQPRPRVGAEETLEEGLHPRNWVVRRRERSRGLNRCREQRRLGRPDQRLMQYGCTQRSRGIEGEAVFPILLAIPLEDEPVRVMGGGPVTMATHRVLWVVIATHPGTVGATGAYALLPAEASKRLAIRYMIAVREMLLELHSHASDRPYHWTPGKPRYGDTYATQAGEWVSDSQLEATIEHKE